jgi:hypothetical protein
MSAFVKNHTHSNPFGFWCFDQLQLLLNRPASYRVAGLAGNV